MPAITAGHGCNVTRVENYVTLPDWQYIKRAEVGYGRVSDRDQHPEAQEDALAGAGCSSIKVSGKLARRPELDHALVQPGWRPTFHHQA